MARFAHTGMSWGKARLSSRGPFTFTHSIELPKVALGRRQVREKGWHSSQGGRRAGVKREGKERTGVSPQSVPGLLTWMSLIGLENTHYSLGCIGRKTPQKYPLPLPSSRSSSYFFVPPPWNHITPTKIKNEQEQGSGSKLCESQFFQLLIPSSPVGGKGLCESQRRRRTVPLQVTNALALTARATRASK